MFDFLKEAWNSSVGFFDIVLMFFSLIVGYFIFKFLSKLTIPGILLGHIGSLTLYLTLLINLVLFFFGAMVFLYNKIITLSDFLGSMPGVSCLGAVLGCAGIADLLSFFYTELFFILITVLGFRVSFLFLSLLDKVSEKIWRIGMLMGQI